MPPALAGPLERIRSAFSTISLGQKVVIGLLGLGLVLGGFFFYRWITAPTYAPLFSNLASTDASAIVDELNAAGVSYELADGGGTIMVPNEQVYDLRLSMSGKGLPAGNDTGYALLDEQASPPASSSSRSPTSGPCRTSCRQPWRRWRACAPPSSTWPCPRRRCSPPTRPSPPPRCCSTWRRAPRWTAARCRR